MYESKNRPLSPHLTIYRIQDTSLTSILQRISGIIIFSLFFVIYLGCFFLLLRVCFDWTVMSLILSFYENYFYVNVSIIIMIIFVCTYHLIKGVLSLLLDIKKC